jgi:hypothetical protein
MNARVGVGGSADCLNRIRRARVARESMRIEVCRLPETPHCGVHQPSDRYPRLVPKREARANDMCIGVGHAGAGSRLRLSMYPRCVAPWSLFARLAF